MTDRADEIAETAGRLLDIDQSPVSQQWKELVAGLVRQYAAEKEAAERERCEHCGEFLELQAMLDRNIQAGLISEEQGTRGSKSIQ